jgi:hypothetical protein
MNLTTYHEIIPSFYCENENAIKNFFLSLFNLNKHQSKIILNEMRERCIHELLKNEYVDIKNMNRLTHKIWLTDKDNGQLPSKEMLEALKNTYNHLSIGDGFKHFLWCNNSKIGNQIIELIGCQNCNNIELRNIDEFSEYIGTKLFTILLKNRLYSNACDILRIQVVHKYGGLYSDFGWSMTNNIPHLLKRSDIMFNGENNPAFNGVISHNVIYSKLAKHILLDRMLTYLEDYHFLLKFPKDNAFSINEIISPCFIMAAVPGLCKHEKVITLVNHSLTFSRIHNHSHCNGSFGCAILSQSKDKVNEQILDYIHSLRK